jgi:uncharacterized NAD(P)/FAD-binding protein YdhS/predicted metal-dependent enzyme (double-stranded beta helix superfamily)
MNSGFPAIEPLIGALLTRSSWTSEDLVAALRTPLDWQSLHNAAQFSSERYVRRSLYHCAEFEVRLLGWLPGQSSALHGHGASACASRVLAGEATETLLDGTIMQHLPGSVASTSEATIHQVANLGTRPLTTLHVYAPPLPVDQPSTPEGRRIVIVGSGWCGAALAIHLLTSGEPNLRVTLIERGRPLGRGIAYATDDDAHLLNVPAGKMSLNPEAPLDFLNYARMRGVAAHPYSLLPRKLYGDYVVDRLAAAIRGSRARLRVCQSEATDLLKTASDWRVVLADGRTIPADDVVLATGHGPFRLPGPLRRHGHDHRVISDPWKPDALARLPLDARVLIVGTGLSATDVLTTLRQRGQLGPVLAISRSGQWPRPHLTTVGWTGEPYDLAITDAPRTADALAVWLRAHIDAASTRGIPWQAVMEAVRPHVAGLWHKLPVPERERFLEHYRTSWEVLRHRTPVATWEALQSWLADGWLQKHRGELRRVEASDAGFRIDVYQGETHHSWLVDAVIVCTGTESDVRRFDQPLWHNLITRGHVRPDGLGLGILTDPRSAVLGERAAIDGLWALGGLRRPGLFESTAVPELALQVQTLARELVRRASRRAAASLPTDIVQLLSSNSQGQSNVRA